MATDQHGDADEAGRDHSQLVTEAEPPTYTVRTPLRGLPEPAGGTHGVTGRGSHRVGRGFSLCHSRRTRPPTGSAAGGHGFPYCEAAEAEPSTRLHVDRWAS